MYLFRIWPLSFLHRKPLAIYPLRVVIANLEKFLGATGRGAAGLRGFERFGEVSERVFERVPERVSEGAPGDLRKEPLQGPCPIWLDDRGTGQWKCLEEVPRRTSLVPLAFPCFVLLLIGVETEGLLDYQGRAGDHFHCTLEPSPGHIQCRPWNGELVEVCTLQRSPGNFSETFSWSTSRAPSFSQSCGSCCPWTYCLLHSYTVSQCLSALGVEKVQSRVRSRVRKVQNRVGKESKN